MRHQPPRINCAKCRCHVDVIRIEEDLRTRQAMILVECHGQVEVMTMDGYQFLEIVRSDIAGTAFENKLESHSDGKTTDQIETPGPSVPGKARQWRCAGFDSRQRYGCGYGWTPQEAYWNWQNDLNIPF